MKSTTIRLEPSLHENQQKVYDCSARFRLVLAGRRFGKTRLGIWEMIIQCLTKPNQKVWYIAPYRNQAKSICWRKLLELIPKEVDRHANETELILRFRSGSILRLEGTDGEDKLRGQDIDFVVLDEAAFMKQHVWEEILRPSLMDRHGRALFLGTPAGMNWYWQLFIKAQDAKDPDFASFKFTSYDNPYLAREEIETAKNQTKNSGIFRQEYLEEPSTLEGLVYPEFIKDIHLVKPFKIPKEARLFRGIDWGIHAPTVCLWGALMPSGETYIYREHVRAGLPAGKQAEIINAMSVGESIESSVIDPSTDKRDATTFNSVRMEFLRNQLTTIPANNRIDHGISVVKEALIQNKLFVFDCLDNTILQFLTYEWSQAQNLETLKEKPKDGNDDCMDALRYLLMHISGKRRNQSYTLDTETKNGTVAEGDYLVTYREGEIANIRPRKKSPGERSEDGFTFDEFCNPIF